MISGATPNHSLGPDIENAAHANKWATGFADQYSKVRTSELQYSLY